MDRVYGVPSEDKRAGSGKRGYAQTFVINILRAFNDTEAQGVPTDAFGIGMLHRYNVAQVAYNLRVVVQQPLAITRAALLIDYGSIIKGMKLNPAAIRKNIQEMQRYSGIAAWKSLGFYDVNISRGLTDIIKHNSTVIDKINDFGMKGAELADTLTWAGIWSACKEEVIKKQRIRPNDEGFFEAVTKLFEDVVYKTQVVDSVLTKNEYLRSKGFLARSIGSFMSEPTTTASMLIDAFDKYNMDMQRGMTRQQAWKNNRRMIVRTAYVYGLSAIILAAVQAVADAFRDDDDYQEWYEKWLEAFGGNLVDELMPLNKLPILSEFYEFVKELISAGGFDIYGQMSNFVWTDIAEQFVKGIEILNDHINGTPTNYEVYGGVYKLLQAVSGMTGLPMAAATREIVTAWNNIVGAMAPSLKVKTYDSGEKNEIKYAYQDGYLTDEEATDLLLEKGLVDNEDEAYWTIQGWEAGEGYSRYDAIFDAVRNGGDFKAAMRELTSHGYTEKEVRSQVKEQIGKWYKDGEVTKQQAINMLTKYAGMESDDITATVNKWSSKVDTGIDYDDIKDEFLNGNITEARAIDMLVRYGGKTKSAAKADVQYWAFKDAYPNTHVEDSWFDTYYNKIADSGIRINVYMEYRNKVSTVTGEDKKERRMDVIHSLPITSAQKDALYYAEGWAASKIHEAPWH
jgi:undecaprenyl pyrophosphate synthase